MYYQASYHHGQLRFNPLENSARWCRTCPRVTPTQGARLPSVTGCVLLSGVFSSLVCLFYGAHRKSVPHGAERKPSGKETQVLRVGGEAGGPKDDGWDSDRIYLIIQGPSLYLACLT